MIKTFAEGSQTATSPSVWAGSWGINRRVSQLRSIATGPPKVSTGHPVRGAAGTFHSSEGTYWSRDRWAQQLEWAITPVPPSANVVFPSVWSKCQWVLISQRGGCRSAWAMPRRISSTRGPYPVSMTAHPYEVPTAVTVPPAPEKVDFRANLSYSQRCVLIRSTGEIDKSPRWETLVSFHTATAFLRAALLEVITAINSFQESTNDFAPSF